MAQNRLRTMSDAVDQIMNYGLDVHNRTLFLTGYNSPYNESNEGEGGVNWELSDRIIKGLHILESISDEGVVVKINNFGGDADHGRAIMSAFQQSHCHLTGIVYGRAQSAAAWILQCCDHRIMSTNSNLMFHMGDTTQGKHSKYVDRIYNQMLLERLQSKDDSWTLRRVENRLDTDWYVYPTQALELGLADEILELKI